MAVNSMNTENIFTAVNLSYRYPGGVAALQSVNFNIHSGELVALVGANGSGKSTILKLMDALLFPSEGELQAFGQPLSEKLLRDRQWVYDFRRRVGLVFQDADVQLFSPTVWDEVAFGPLQLKIPHDEVVSRCNESLEMLNISHLKERPPHLLSGGEKKKVSLASVLSLRPAVLLLDEPTTGLDPRSQGRLIDFLLQWSTRGNSLVFSTQDMDMVEEIATRVLVLGPEHDIIADGPPETFLTDADFLVRTNLIHEHSHRHKAFIHRHPHSHEHQHGEFH